MYIFMFCTRAYRFCNSIRAQFGNLIASTCERPHLACKCTVKKGCQRNLAADFANHELTRTRKIRRLPLGIKLISCAINSHREDSNIASFLVAVSCVEASLALNFAGAYQCDQKAQVLYVIGKEHS